MLTTKYNLFRSPETEAKVSDTKKNPKGYIVSVLTVIVQGLI